MKNTTRYNPLLLQPTPTNVHNAKSGILEALEKPWLDHTILEHNVNTLGLEKRVGKVDREYTDLVNLMQLQKGRENITSKTKQLFELITKEKLDPSFGRQRVELAFHKATNEEFSILWPDQIKNFIDKDPDLRKIAHELKTKHNKEAVYPGGFINEIIYFLIVKRRRVPVVDQHDLFGHLIGYCDPLIQKQTLKMVDLYQNYISLYGVHKHDIFENKTQEAIYVSLIDIRHRVQEDNPYFDDFGRVTYLGAASANNPKVLTTHKAKARGIMYSALMLPLKLATTNQGKSTNKLLYKHTGKTLTDLMNMRPEILNKAEEEFVYSESDNFYTNFQQACHYIKQNIGELGNLFLNNELRAEYIDCVLQDIEALLKNLEH